MSTEEEEPNPIPIQEEAETPAPVVAEEKDASSTEDVPTATSTPSDFPSQLSNTTFQDDGTFALPPGETVNVTTPVKPAVEPVDASSDNPPGSSKGAQILMNRFSNWRQKANENASALYNRAREAQEQATRENKGPLAALRQVAAVDGGVSKKESNSVESSSYESEDDEEESSSNSRDCSRDEDKEAEETIEKQQEAGDEGTPMSARSLPNLPSRREVRSRVQNLAGGVINNLDSVATGFRGRYANANEWKDTGRAPPPTNPNQQNQKESQTALILKSRAAEHLQEILNSLEPYQYVMLLGAGRLQVNLKNPYVKHQGTYVDFLVTGGAADKSGVVAVGDSIVKVGPQDVRKHTIADVPSIIAKAKRPVVLVLTTGVEMEVERITYLDLAVAMMHRIRDQDEEQRQAMIASAQKHKEERATVEGDESKPEDEATTTATESPPIEEVGTPREEEPNKDAQFKNISIPFIRSVEGYANPPQLPTEACQAYKNLVGKRYVPSDCGVNYLSLLSHSLLHSLKPQVYYTTIPF